MDEVNIEPVDAGDEVGIGVDPRFDLSPVVLVQPVIGELADRIEADALRGPIPRLLENYEGPGVIETYSVPYGRDGRPAAACVVARTPAGERFLARVDDADGLDFLTSGAAEPVGSQGTAALRADGYVIWRRG